MVVSTFPIDVRAKNPERVQIAEEFHIYILDALETYRCGLALRKVVRGNCKLRRSMPDDNQHPLERRYGVATGEVNLF